ncbi:hypothetical protein OG373_04240 [Streptomyces avidinii]|uniref:hypothetical protein n=1 Tax=Streptomyces avidinii TaxID=1895 RepID=UPI00386EB9F2|nr:hypothetical protein OG592_04400 [Streptomyces avidinii]WTA95634.1 hypothetical protein OG373_04240 [Streptomyces avidinii]
METADVAALGGQHDGGVIARWLTGRSSQAAGVGVPIEVGEALAWVSPQRIGGSAAELAARGKLYLHRRVFATLLRIRVSQGERVLRQRQVPKLIPSLPALLSATWLARVDPHGSAVRIEVLA